MCVGPRCAGGRVSEKARERKRENIESRHTDSEGFFHCPVSVIYLFDHLQLKSSQRSGTHKKMIDLVDYEVLWVGFRIKKLNKEISAF